MGEAVKNVDVAPKKSKLKSLKSEFKKITWPDKHSLVKQTIAVVIITVILGLIIAGVDAIFKVGINFVLGIG